MVKKAEVPEEEYYIPLGKADVKKAGTDVTIVSFNKMMKVALGAAAELEKEDISAEVIDLPYHPSVGLDDHPGKRKKDESPGDC